MAITLNGTAGITAPAVTVTGNNTIGGLQALAAGANIASAATVDLTAATGNCPRITGTTAISAFTMNTGQQMLLVADGALPLTYNATTNKIVGGVSVTLAAGDLIEVFKDLSGIIQTSVPPVTTGSVPAGAILNFGGTAVPSGYLGCDGTAVSRSTYSALFSAISTTWGIGDGSTTFNVPNFQRRTSVGSGGTGTGTLGNAVGNTGGAETHTLTTAELAAHTHPLSGGPNAVTPASIVTVSANATPSSANTGSAGGGGSHNNMQPSAVVLKIIKT